MDADEPAEALSVRRTGDTEHGVAAVLGGIEREEEHREAETPARQIEIPQGVFAACVVADPADQQEGQQIERDEHPRADVEWQHVKHQFESSLVQ